MKSKDKLSLVDDYISIMYIFNFCEYVERKCIISDENKLEVKALQLNVVQLKSIYEEIFRVLNLMDFSMMILKRDLDNLEINKKIQKINISDEIALNNKKLSNLSEKLRKQYNIVSSNNDYLHIS